MTMTQIAHEPNVLVPQKRLCAELDLTDRTLRDWRDKGTGPVYTRVGRRVFYMRRDIDAWLAAGRFKHRAAEANAQTARAA
jgi:hypothetical protein